MDVTTVVSMPVNMTSAINQGEGGHSRAVQAESTVSVPPVSSQAHDSIPVGTQGSSSPEAIAKGISQLNDAFTQNGVSLYASYEKDKITGIEVVQFKDKNTHEVIRQIPSKVALAIAQSLELPQGWIGQLIYDKS